MEKGFLKLELVKETHKVKDSMGLENEKVTIKKFLEKAEGNTVVGLVGKHGIGKSTLLHQVEKEMRDIDWIDFDAWQFPDKTELWDGLCLKVAEYLEMRQAAEDWISGVTIGTETLSVLAKLVKLEGVEKLFAGRPITRGYQFFKILQKMLAYFDKPVVIVIEDVDRAGEDGLRFLETLHQLIADAETKLPVTVFVLIGSDAYASGIATYTKCLDVVQFFEPKISSLNKFFESVLVDAAFQNKALAVSQLSSFFLKLIQDNEYVNLRLIKSILRRANSSFSHFLTLGYRPDPRLIILAETTQFVTTGKQSKQKVMSNIRELHMIQEQPFVALGTAVMLSSQDIYSRSKELLSPRAGNFKLSDIDAAAEIWTGADPEADTMQDATFIRGYYFQIL